MTLLAIIVIIISTLVFLALIHELATTGKLETGGKRADLPPLGAAALLVWAGGSAVLAIVYLIGPIA